jgi:hypothetical protein
LLSAIKSARCDISVSRKLEVGRLQGICKEVARATLPARNNYNVGPGRERKEVNMDIALK